MYSTKTKKETKNKTKFLWDIILSEKQNKRSDISCGPRYAVDPGCLHGNSLFARQFTRQF